ncbi:M14 family metallopeptidase [Salibacterium sp. K-3]
MVTYDVKKGDTLRKIAARFQIEPEQLLYENGLSWCMYLEPGTTLTIPQSNRHRGTKGGEPCLHEYGWRELEEDRCWLPSWIHNEKIGTSVLGKPLWLFRAGSGSKKIFISGTWHGNEWLNTWLLMKFLSTLAEKAENGGIWNGIDIRALLHDTVLYVMPLVNPDGVELVQEGAAALDEHRDEIMDINGGMNDFRHWSANAHGVDLNHQWPADWKEEAAGSPVQPFPRHFGGKAPLTEPEAQAVYRLSMKEEFSHVLAFHSQGEEVYWGYRGMEPTESRELGRRLAAAGSFRQVENADSGAGYRDWFIKTFRRPGFTVETGTGNNPLPPDASARIWVTSVPLLLESCTFPDFTQKKRSG